MTDRSPHKAELRRCCLTPRNGPHEPFCDVLIYDTELAQRAELDALRAERDLLAGILTQVEWHQPTHNGNPSCPWCEEYMRDGHSASCALAAAIGRKP